MGLSWPLPIPGEKPHEYRLRLTGGQRSRIRSTIDRRRGPTEEQALQASIVEALAAHGMDKAATLFSVPNEGKRSPVMAELLKSMGMLPGVTDLVIVADDGPAHFMEVKTETGQLSKKQAAFRDRCEARGLPWSLCRSVDQALAAVRGWGLIGAASRLPDGTLDPDVVDEHNAAAAEPAEPGR